MLQTIGIKLKQFAKHALKLLYIIQLLKNVFVQVKNHTLQIKIGVSHVMHLNFGWTLLKVVIHAKLLISSVINKEDVFVQFTLLIYQMENV